MKRLLLAVCFSVVLLLGSTGLSNVKAAAQTSISLDMPVEKSFPVTQGDSIVFTGQLIRASTLAGIPNAQVNIVQQVSFGQSKVLASGETDEEGSYAIPWIVDVESVAGKTGGSFGTETTQGRENRYQVVVVARFEGDEQYTHSVSTAQSFEVRLNELAITVDKQSTYLAFEDAIVTILVTDIDGLLVDPDTITSRFDGNPVTLIQQDIGIYVFSVASLSPGSHQLQILVQKRGYTSDDELITLDVLKRKTSISIAADKSSYKLGETVNIHASLIDQSTNEVVTDRVVTGALAAPNLAVKQLTFIEGKASYTLSKSDVAGTWTVSASFPGDLSYFSSAAQTTFTVTKEVAVTPTPTPVAEKVKLSRVTLVDQTGDRLRDITVGQQVMIQAKITSKLQATEQIAYISQVKDSEGITVALSWITGTLAPGQALELAVSWIPEASGEYTAEVFVWKSIKEPEPLADVKTSTITVA